MNSWCSLAVSKSNEGCVLLKCCQSSCEASEEYQILAVNEAFEHLTGFRAEQCVNKLLSDLPTDMEPLVRDAIIHARKNNISVFGYHSRRLGKYLEVTCCRQSKDHFVFIANDLTVCKKADLMLGKVEEVVNSTEQAKYNFLTTMSHEALTPLNGMLGMLGLLKETPLTSEQIELVNLAENASKRMNTFITNVLEYSMAGSEMIACPRPMNLHNVLKTMFEEPLSFQQNSSISISYWIDPMIPTTVIGDECIIRKALSKLVDNAIKYAGVGPITLDVSITAYKEGHCRILFSLADRGPGIDNDKIGYLFQPFTQASEGLTRTHEGAGLGLAICKQLVELLNGTMAVETHIGEGTTFHICLPFELCHQDVLKCAERQISKKWI